ncbi:kinase-like protein [Punctularia strigosozonata HHB-11173 SS5]|uniref:kinase-like protein n=1 Tax=Punctularia strigosozonata (strain HHB-11173) TaxID=741275 RepID=UPI0004417F6A|nr:kinase-like protein [Punctularia strigosozonata HHB-11173 SS5]EIN13762.1 kinase-like protein [Punctularia strigosozonata HHB-11173 SS5]
MYPTSHHVQPGHNANHNAAYNTHQPLPNGNGHHHHHHSQHPNGHSHTQPPPQSHRPPPAQAAAPKGRITVYAVPSITFKGDDVIVGDAQSTSRRSYTPLKMVGDGSFGTVWLCDWHEQLPPKTPLSAMQCNTNPRPEYAGRRLVAVKRMKKKWEGGWDECKNLKELESLRAIPYHQNIIPLYDFFLLPETKELYFVFESMEGNLYQLIKSRRGRPLAGGLVSSIFRQIISGLHHIHASGYFHRDMKPENLLVTTTGLHDYRNLSPHALPGAPPEKDVVVIVKLADFGLARETKSRPPYTEYVSTRWYRAPEVLLRSKDYSNPVDMWALGAIMAELVNLRPLFPGQDEIDQVTKICAVLGDPVEDYGTDPRGKPIGGGQWPKGIKMAKAVGFAFPKMKPHNLARLFDSNVHPKLVECIVDLLRYDPQERLTSLQCIQHAYLQETTPLVDLPAPTLRYATSEPSVPVAASAHAPRQAAELRSSESMPSVVARDVPSAQVHASGSHPNLPKAPFNGSPHLRTGGIPDAATSHRTAFYASTSSVTQSPSRATTDYGRPIDATVVPPVPVYAGARSNSSWPDGHSMDTSSAQRAAAPPGSPMAQDSQPPRPQVPQVQVNGMDPQAPVHVGKPGKFFGKKWALGGMFGSDKAHALAAGGQSPAEESTISASPTVHTLKRAKSSSLDGHTNPELTLSPAELKKLQKKEADRIQKEAERSKRMLAEKRQLEQARAVMQKRRQMANAGGIVDTHNVPLHFVHGAAGVAAAEKEKQVPLLQPRQVDTNMLSPSAGHVPEHNDRMLGAHAEERWREDHHRMAKARRRDWDDDHSMSSSDVQSVGRMSVISFATVDSDPGPPHLRHRPSLFGLDRMTSTSSLRTSFGDSDQFPQSVRSSNSLSLEQQLASEFRMRATMDATSSPPPLNMLTLSPTQHRWDQVPKREGSLSPGFQRPTHIDLPPPRFTPQSFQPGQHSPYELGSDLTAHPMSPGELPKSAINPIFKVPTLPPGASDSPASPNALPPFSHLEAVAEGEYPPLSPMSFAGGED